jgi:hypothetical protein
MDVDAIRNEVEDAGRRHYAAASAGDTDALEQLLAEDLVYTYSDGSTDDKNGCLERVIGGRYHGKTVDHSVEHLIVLSDDLAIVRSRQITNTTGEAELKMENVESASLDVWAKRDDRWQLVGHQGTFLWIGENWRKAFEAGRE